MNPILRLLVHPVRRCNPATPHQIRWKVLADANVIAAERESIMGKTATKLSRLEPHLQQAEAAA